MKKTLVIFAALLVGFALGRWSLSPKIAEKAAPTIPIAASSFPAKEPAEDAPKTPDAAANDFAAELPALTDTPVDNAPLMVSTVKVGDAEGPPPMTDATLNAIQRFDYAMDREFDRLDQREEFAGDETEVATINTIKEKLGDLDDLYRRADLATNTEERVTLRKEMQKTMGSIIGLSRRDRNERLSKLATDIGYTDPVAVEQFVREIDRVYRETHMDWTKLFNRTPPAMAPAGDRSVSPGMTPDDVESP